MSRTFTGQLTGEQLAGAIAYAFATGDRFQGEVPPSGCKNALDFLKKNNFRTGRVTRQIEDDLKKVQFDEENLEWEAGEGYSGTESITGFHTLPNGLTYLGITAGGDWEIPLFYIVYYDGTKLRGYIPEAGNQWNTDTKTAYGSEGESGVEDEEAAQEANLQKRFGVKAKEDLPDMDPAVLLDDIARRIVPAQGRFVAPKGLADIDEDKFDSDKKERDEKAAENAKEWEKRHSGMDSVRIMTIRGTPTPKSAPVPADPINGKSLYDILDDIKQEAQVFVSEVERLRGMPISPEALAEAEIMRDKRLRGIVGRFCTVVEGIRAGI